MTRSIFSRLTLIAALASTVPVATQVLPAIAAEAPDGNVTAPINILDEGLKQIISPNAGSFADREKIMANAVDQSYDLTTVLKASIGPVRYAGLSPDDQTRLLKAFREYTIARYVSSFAPGSKISFKLGTDVRESPVGTGKIVPTRIIPDDGSDPTALDYVMVQTSGGWRIADVLLVGHISQAAAQRADFSSTLAASGVDGLISVLDRKVKAFSSK